MDEVAQLARQLLDSGVTRLSEREQRVILHIAKRSHVARNVNSVLEEQQTLGERLADRVAQFGGSWTFITIFTGMLMAWIVLNSVALVRIGGGFDPYPYIFLNLILSMVAALQAPVILMSQNRQAARDRLAASLDYEVNLKAEVEIMALHDKLDRIRVEHLEGLLQDQTQRVQELDKMVRATLAKPLSSWPAPNLLLAALDRLWAMGLPQACADVLYGDKPLDMCQLAQALFGWDAALSSSHALAKIWW
jgi:uncharacterized membrane protein